MARKTRYTTEQIALALQQHQGGIPMHEIIRKYGVSQQTFYRWKSKYGGPRGSDFFTLSAGRSCVNRTGPVMLRHATRRAPADRRPCPRC